MGSRAGALAGCGAEPHEENFAIFLCFLATVLPTGAWWTVRSGLVSLALSAPRTAVGAARPAPDIGAHQRGQSLFDAFVSQATVKEGSEEDAWPRGLADVDWSKPARTAVRLVRPIRRDLGATTRSGALADARRPALQSESQRAPAVLVQRRCDSGMRSTQGAAGGGEGEAVLTRAEMSKERRPRGREVHARAPCRRVEEGDIAAAALRPLRGRACRT